MSYIRKFFGHLNTINKHRFLVFKLSIKAGIPIRGLLHDLSKYSIEEFFPSVKNYTNGLISPIKTEKNKIGYSTVWLHHKGRNKHHFEYWYDFNTKNKTPIIPFKYFCELVCDQLAAGMTYKKKKWNEKSSLEHFKNRNDLEYINDKIKTCLIKFYEYSVKVGYKKALNKKTLRRFYDKYVFLKK